jgi:phosphoribosylanthranilate isomerase
MTEIKFCGITRVEDGLAAEAAGANAVGFVFAPSPRQVTVARAREISSRLGPGVARVGVFVDADSEYVRAVAQEAGLDLVQLHGRETRESAEDIGVPFLKAHRARDEGVLHAIRDFGSETFLLDAYVPGLAGGTGAGVDLDLAVRARALGRMVLAGGLGPWGVAEVIRRVRPCAVDVSSGVESAPGRKDHEALKSFAQEVRRCSPTTEDTSARTGAALFRRRS